MITELKLTNNGITLLTNLAYGSSVKFTKIEMGSGTYTGKLEEAVALTKVNQTIEINRLIRETDNTIIIGGNLLGKDVVQGFEWKEVGIFAIDDDNPTTQVLVAYGYSATDNSYIPEGGLVVEQLIDFLLQITNDENGNIYVDDSMMFITKKEYDTDMNELKQTIAPKATTQQAQEGTNDTTYMTPKKVMDFAEKNVVTVNSSTILIISDVQPSPIVGKTIIWIDINS